MPYQNSSQHFETKSTSASSTQSIAQQKPTPVNPILDSLTTAIMHLTITGEVLYINPACENFLETSVSKILGRKAFDFFIEPTSETSSAGRPSFAQLMHNCITRNQPVTQRECLVRVGFQEKLADYTISPLTNNYTSNTDIESAIIEIHPIARLHSITQNQQLSEQHRIAREVVKGLAHEIKNPLGGIKGASQLLDREISTQPNLKEYTQIILAETERLKELVDSMLGSSQLSQFDSVNIHEPIEYVLKLLKSQIKATDNVEIVYVRDYDLSLPDLMADRNKLVQVLLNISANAIEAMQDNPRYFIEQQIKPTLTIKTRVFRMMTLHGELYRQVMRIDIIDNGIGIEPDLIDRIFFPMVTGKASGTGLGLSIAQDIVASHHGIITCQSIIGQTTFSLFIPWRRL